MHHLSYNLDIDHIPVSKRINNSSLKIKFKENVDVSIEKVESMPELRGRNINWRSGINAVNPETGLTPLMVAAIQGKKDLLTALIERGADVASSIGKKGRNALHEAAYHGHHEIISELLKRGGVVNSTDDHQKTPLLLASKSGYLRCVQVLVAAGASVNSADDHGFTSLHYAARFGHQSIIEYLIQNRAIYEIRDNVDGLAPLHFAAQYGRKECTQVLLDYGAKINRRSSKYKMTALMFAAKEGNKSVVSLLLARSANARLSDIYGWTALHFTASWGRRDTAHILLVESGATADINGSKAGGDSSNVDLLVNLRPKPRDQSGGLPALIIAAKNAQNEVLKLLLQYGALVDLPDISTGHSALALAAGLGLPQTVQLLLDYGAQINRRSYVTGRTALMEAVLAGNTSNSNSSSSLSQGSNRGAMICLLNSCADLNILDFIGYSVWELAVQAHREEVLLDAILHCDRRAKINALPWLQLTVHHLLGLYHRKQQDTALAHGRYHPSSQRSRAKLRRLAEGGATTLQEDSSWEGNNGYDGKNKGNKDSGFHSVALYLKALLFEERGIFAGLYSLSADGDIYLVYALVMINHACCCFDRDQQQVVDTRQLVGGLNQMQREDAAILQAIKQQVDSMLERCLLAESLQNDWINLLDTLVLSQHSARKMLPYLVDGQDLSRLFASTFFFGPWAIYLDTAILLPGSSDPSTSSSSSSSFPTSSEPAGKRRLLCLQTMQEVIEEVTWAWDKEHGLVVDGYGFYSEKYLYPRYRPGFMMLFEGLGKVACWLVIFCYTRYDSHYSTCLLATTSSSYGSQGEHIAGTISTLEAVLALFTLSFTLYELGEIEESRWSISPCIVFLQRYLEKQRWQRVYRHFNQDPFRFLDGILLLLLLLWLILRILASFSALPQHLVCLSASAQTISLCLAPLALALIKYPSILWPQVGQVIWSIFYLLSDILWPFLWIYGLSGLGFGTAIYALLSSSAITSSSSSGIVTAFSTPALTLQTLFSGLFFAYDISTVLDTTNQQQVAGYVTAWILLAGFMVCIAGICSLALLARVVVAAFAPVHMQLVQQSYYLWRARLIQRHSLTLEKSPLCMLAMPWNLIGLFGYVPHVYWIWSNHLAFDHDLSISPMGMVSDWLLFALLALPCATYEYLMLKVFLWLPPSLPSMKRQQRHPSSKVEEQDAIMELPDPPSVLLRCISLLVAPIGIIYACFCLCYKISQDLVPRVFVKSRVVDGRLRLSHGSVRDAWERHVLSRYEDRRLHAHLRSFYDEQLAEEEELQDERDPSSAANYEKGLTAVWHEQAAKRGSDGEGEEESEEEEEEEKGERGASSDSAYFANYYRDLTNSGKVSGKDDAMQSSQQRYKPHEKRLRSADFLGKKIKITPMTKPFLQLKHVRDPDFPHVHSQTAAAAAAAAAASGTTVREPAGGPSAVALTSPSKLVLGELDRFSSQTKVSSSSANLAELGMDDQQQQQQLLLHRRPRLVYQQPTTAGEESQLTISQYQAGIDYEQQWAELAMETEPVFTHRTQHTSANNNPAVAAAMAASSFSPAMLAMSTVQQQHHPLSATLQEEQQHILHQQAQSLYFLPYKRSALFTAKEREEIFKLVLPTFFPRDHVVSLQMVERKLDDMEKLFAKLLLTHSQQQQLLVEQQAQQQQQQQMYSWQPSNSSYEMAGEMEGEDEGAREQSLLKNTYEVNGSYSTAIGYLENDSAYQQQQEGVYRS